MLLKSWGEAKSRLDRVLQSDPTRNAALKDRAVVNFALSSFTGAVHDLSAVLALCPQDPEALANRSVHPLFTLLLFLIASSAESSAYVYRKVFVRLPCTLFSR